MLIPKKKKKGSSQGVFPFQLFLWFPHSIKNQNEIIKLFIKSRKLF